MKKTIISSTAAILAMVSLAACSGASTDNAESAATDQVQSIIFQDTKFEEGKEYKVGEIVSTDNAQINTFPDFPYDENGGVGILLQVSSPNGDIAVDSAEIESGGNKVTAELEEVNLYDGLESDPSLPKSYIVKNVKGGDKIHVNVDGKSIMFINENSVETPQS